nr:hypothetical protein [Bacteroidota bacterium]
MDGYDVVMDFEQKFSHYHSACVSIYKVEINEMNNIFFGGMARYYVDAGNGDIKDDPLVPSVNTISQVTRFADGHYEEVILDTKMPGLLGASANYIPVKSIPLVYGKIVDYDRLPIGKTLIGYIYGGLESTHPNIFLQALGVSVATNRAFKVYVSKP